jgi:hypothetical protein
MSSDHLEIQRVMKRLQFLTVLVVASIIFSMVNLVLWLWCPIEVVRESTVHEVGYELHENAKVPESSGNRGNGSFLPTESVEIGRIFSKKDAKQ